MKRINVTDLYHNLLDKLMTKESIIVDATCGNGHDTLFLAKRVKHVYAFDIQQSAIDHSKLLTKDYNNITYYLKSHTLITELIEKYDGVVFNLGYLPGSDKLITTHRDTTILALKKLHIKKRGFIIVVAYPGHKEGLLELVAIQSFLDQQRIIYEVIKLPHFTIKDAPVIYYYHY